MEIGIGSTDCSVEERLKTFGIKLPEGIESTLTPVAIAATIGVEADENLGFLDISEKGFPGEPFPPYGAGSSCREDEDFEYVPEYIALGSRREVRYVKVSRLKVFDLAGIGTRVDKRYRLNVDGCTPFSCPDWDPAEYSARFKCNVFVENSDVIIGVKCPDPLDDPELTPSDPPNGIVLTSPNGTLYKITVSNGGILEVEPYECP